MSLANALDAALKLKAALTTEVARAQDVRRLLRTIDSQSLLAQASLREAFNQHSSWLSGELARALAAWAATQGLPDVTVEELCVRAPFEGEQLRSAFAEIRALSASLAELDALNTQIAQRTLSFVSAYVTHLSPRASAYTRRGMPAVIEGGTHSEHA